MTLKSVTISGTSTSVEWHIVYPNSINIEQSLDQYRAILRPIGRFNSATILVCFEYQNKKNIFRGLPYFSVKYH